MARTVNFDTHAYVKKLTAVGFTEEQAEAQAEALADTVDEKLATKRNLKEMEMRLTIKLGVLGTTGIIAVTTLVKIL